MRWCKFPCSLLVFPGHNVFSKSSWLTSYKKQLDWLVILLDAFWLAHAYFLKGGEAKRCRVECASVLNSLATFHILRLLFSSWKFVNDVKASSLIQKEARCLRFLEGIRQGRRIWSKETGGICGKLVHWSIAAQFVEWLYIVTNTLGKLDWEITEKEAKVKVDLSQKAVLIHREIFLRFA